MIRLATIMLWLGTLGSALCPVHALAQGWQVTRLKVGGAAVESATLAIIPAGGALQQRTIRIDDRLSDGTEVRAAADTEIELTSPGNMRLTKESGDSGALLLTAVDARGEQVDVRRGRWAFSRVAGAMGRALDPFAASAGSAVARTRGTEFTVAVDEAAGLVRFHVQQGQIHVSQPTRVRVAGGSSDLLAEARRVLSAGDAELSLPFTPGAWLQRFGNYDDALTAFEAQLRDAEARQDRDATVDALIALGDMRVLAGRPADAQPAYARALDLSQSPGDAYWRAELLGRQGAVLQALNRFAEAAQAFRESLAIHDSVQLRPGEYTLEEESTNIAINLLRDGTLRCADSWAQRLLAALDDKGAGPSRHIRAPLLAVRGEAASGLNQPQAALDWDLQVLDMQQTRALATRKASADVAAALIALGRDETDLRRFVSAEKRHRDALAMADSLFTPPHPLKADAHVGLALLERARGRTARGLAEVRQAMQVLDALPPDVVRRGTAWMVQAELLLDSKRPADSVSAFRSARTLLTPVWTDSSHPLFQTLLPDMARALRRSGAAEADAREAEETAVSGALALQQREAACPQ